MREGWLQKTLGDVCHVYQPETISQKQMTGGDCPVYGANGQIGWHNQFNHEESQLILGCRGSCGSVHLTEPRSWINGNAMVVQPRIELIHPSYLGYALKGGVDLADAITGTAQPQITRTSLMPLVISFPEPLPEQQRIVALLDEAFSGFVTANANAERNLQNACALFESHLQSVFSQRGEGWVEATVGETCTLKSGATVPPAMERPAGDIPYLKVADMSFVGNEDQIITSSRFLMKTDVKEASIIPKGATIFPKRGGAIMTNKKRISALPICADLNIMSVIPSQKISARFLYYYFLNVDMRRLGTGSSIPQINNYDVEPLEISFPESLAIQEEFVQLFDCLREETQRLTRLYERKLAALEELKKSLLHQAFNGEL
jgi:type I restriction enzyme S subunit